MLMQRVLINKLKLLIVLTKSLKYLYIYVSTTDSLPCLTNFLLRTYIIFCVLFFEGNNSVALTATEFNICCRLLIQKMYGRQVRRSFTEVQM